MIDILSSQVRRTSDRFELMVEVTTADTFVFHLSFCSVLIMWNHRVMSEIVSTFLFKLVDFISSQDLTNFRVAFSL